MKKILIFIVLLAGYFTSVAQDNDSTRYVHYKFQYGSWMDRYRADKVLMPPKDTSYSKDGIVVLSNGDFYIGNGIKWTKYISGTGTISTGNTYVVANEAAMTSIDTAQVGDVAVTLDSSKSFILQYSPPTTLSNWVQLLFPASVETVFGRTGAITAQSSDYSAYYQPIISNLSDTSKYLKKIDSTGNTGFATNYQLGLKVDEVGTNSDSTALWYRIGTDTTTFYNINTGLTGGDTTVFQTVIDSTGQPGQRVLWSANSKIHSDQYFLYDSANRKLVIGNKNISVGGPNTKLYVVGNTIINGNITAAAIIKQGGTSSQYLMADGSVTTSAGGSVNSVTGNTPITITGTSSDPIVNADTTTANTGLTTLYQNSLNQKKTDSVNVALLNGGKIDTSHIPIQNITIANEGAGTALARGSNDSIYFKRLQAGTNVTFTQNPDSSITISATGGGGTGGISKIVAGYGQTQVNDSTTNVDTSKIATVYANSLKQDKLTLTTTGSSGAATLSGGTLNIPQYAGGGSNTTADSTLIATAGQTSFTFSSVPTSTKDYIIFINGNATESFTASGNTITVGMTDLLAGDKVRYKRIK